MTKAYPTRTGLTALATLAAGVGNAADTGPVPQQIEVIEVLATKIGSGQTRATFVLAGQDIAERPLGADVTQSLAKVPGVQVSTGDARGGSFSFELYLRGLNKEQIGLTIDGIPTGDARFNGGSPPQRFMDSSNIASIEVSQSAGDIGAPSRFALGGFVDFKTDDPARDAGLTTELGTGSDDFYRGYLRADTGESSNGWSAMASYSYQENDIWAGPKNRSSERDHGELKVVKRWQDGSFLKARASYNDQSDNDFNIITLDEFRADPDNDRASDTLAGIPARDVDFGGALGGTREDFLAYVNGLWQVGDNTQLTLNPYYQTLDGESFRYQDRSRQLAGGDPRAVTGYTPTGGAIRPAVIVNRNSNALGGPADMRVTPRDRERYGVTGEARFSEIASRHTVRLGFWWEGGDSTEDRNFYPLIDSARSIDFDRGRLNYVEYQRSTTLETTMFYAQDSIELLPDTLRADLGVTWFDVKYRAKSPLEYAAAVSFSQESNLNPKVALSWQPVVGLEIFGGYAQNFAGIPEDAFLGSTAVINPGDLDPIETENFDLGVRYTGGNYVLSLQGYSVELKNNIGIVPRDPTVVDPDEIVRGNVATRAANIDGLETLGLELTAIADFDWFDVYGAYSYQDAKHDDPPAGSQARANLAAVGVIGGERVRDIPTHSFYGQIGIGPFKGVSFQLNGRYVGERVGGHIIAPTTFIPAGVEQLPSYTLLGANVSYDLPVGWLSELRLQLNVDNLLDEEYLGAVSSATATQPEFGLLTGPTVRTLDRYFIGAPRTVTFSVRARF
ncbi:TonB-dependent receptor [Steroidobacter sp. S1-65]|uniref:TonB-dependent receptor n=1 Tax=Steroidobacter gossypii TaxID=2805490 RepID=A0ABS1WVK6_9GAMM|nr:TonB-dependent receptor [Steroidobacter gossypii]MBM0105010.1 TonB-dependent receptor [Steroidobacter gossypii]